jgi:hypothetical protein
MNNVKYESRLIRPFLHAEDIKDLFAATSIRLKFGDQFSTLESQILRPEDVPLAKPAIFLAIDRRHASNLVKKVGVTSSDARLIVIATSNEMKLSEVISSHELEDFPEDEIELQPALGKFLQGKDGCEITIALVLRNELVPKPLRPHLFGNWLARKIFHLRPEKPSEGFKIRPLSEENRLRLKLPEGTCHYVEKFGSLNDVQMKAQDAVTIWVSEPIYNALSRNQTSAASAAIQKLMLSEITTTLVCDELSEIDEPIEAGSPLDAFFEELAKSSKTKKESLIQCAGSTGDRARLRAHVQQLLDVNGAIKSAV